VTTEEKMSLFCSPNKLLLGVLVAVGIAFSSAASSQTYPDRPIMLIVPFPPGGIADATARIVGSALGEELGQSIIVENRGGGGGNLGLSVAARATPDGYTLVMTPNSPLTMNPFMFKSYPIDPEKGLTPIAMIGEGAIGLVVLASSPINSVKDVIAAAKAKPGELTFGHIGVGSSHYFAGLLLNKKADIQITPVPFQGAGPALNNLMGGFITMSYGTLSGVMPFVQSGKFKLLAVAESKRLKQLPDVPTIAETVPGVVTATWEGFFAPAGTPKAIIDRLSEATKKVLGSAEVQEKLNKVGVVPGWSSPEELGRTVHSELTFWREEIEALGLAKQ
jgi:tripartite-type tricarboxylate transporter receptor subunit TctC